MQTTWTLTEGEKQHTECQMSSWMDRLAMQTQVLLLSCYIRRPRVRWEEFFSWDIFQSARRQRDRSIYMHSPMIFPCSEIKGFFSIKLTVMWEAQVACLELKADNRLDKTQRPVCPQRESSLAERKPGEPVTCPTALEAPVHESPLAETIKVNKN